MSTNHYRVLREDVGLSERPRCAYIEIRGTDRASFLQGLLTNNIETLTEGDGCYAAYLTPQGRVITDLDVFNFGDVLLIEMDVSVRELLFDRFEALVFAEDVQIVDLGSEWTSIGLYGPEAGRLLQDVSGSLYKGLMPYQHCPVKICDIAVQLIRTDSIGIPEFRIVGLRPAVEKIHTSLVSRGVCEVSNVSLESVRVESGRPMFGKDIDENTIPLEAGIEDRAIDFDKGCYVGQEVIIRILHRGQGRIARKLVGLTLADGSESDVPEKGAKLWSNDVEAGRVTSAVYSPALDRPIALGYVTRAYSEPGEVVTVGADGPQRTAVVTGLPFVRSDLC